MTQIIFYIFGAMLLLSATMVVVIKNPIHAALFLVLSFFSSAAIWLLLGAEFLAMILIIVYVGAVAVLFLFVVMMLDINFVKLREGFLKYLPIASIIGVILLSELTIIFLSKKMTTSSLVEYSSSPNFSSIGNTKELGLILYTDYFYLFQISGIILLVAMIGSITLTLRQRKGVKKQSIYKQVTLSSKSQVEKKKIPLGKGLE